MWLTIVSSMGYNLVPGVSGIIYGVSGGYNQLVLRVSDNSSTSFLVFFGHFRLFSGNSDVFIRLPLVSSLGCNSVPGVSCTFYGVVGGYSSTFLTGVFGYFGRLRGFRRSACGLPWCFLWVATLSRGFHAFWFWASGGFRQFVNMFYGYFRSLPVVFGYFLGVNVANHWVFYGLPLSPGGFRHYLWGFRGL